MSKSKLIRLPHSRVFHLPDRFGVSRSALLGLGSWPAVGGDNGAAGRAMCGLREEWVMGCGAGEEQAVGRGLREPGARGAPSQASRASRCWNKGRPTTAAFDGQGRLLPGLLIRMQIQLWSPFLWRQTEGCLCVCKDEACLNKSSSIGWVSKNKPVGQTLATSSPPPNYKVWICYNSLTRRFSCLLVSLLIKRPGRAWRQMTEAQSGENCS